MQNFYENKWKSSQISAKGNKSREKEKLRLYILKLFLITGILLIYHVLSRFIEKKCNTLLNAMSYWLLCILWVGYTQPLADLSRARTLVLLPASKLAIFVASNERLIKG